MSAHDDYPIGHVGDASDDRTIGVLLNIRSQMCDEIDALRDDVSKLLAKLATTDAEWP